MEVRTGKETEGFDLLPEDWQVKKIYEFSTPVRGGSPRPAGDPRYFNGNFIPWLTVAALTNIPQAEIYVSQTDGFLTEEGSRFSRTLDVETLIIANSGATLGVAKLLAIRCCANDGIAALLNISKNVDKKYLVYYINTLTKKLREVIATGNGQPNLNTTLISNIRVPLPPTKTEQTAIATALGDADALISSLEKLIAKKRNIKQGAMQQLLQPKEGWEVRKLGDVGKCWRGVSYDPATDLFESDSEKSVRLFRSNNVQNDLIDLDGLQFVNRSRVKDVQYLKDNDIVICMANGSKQLVGKSAFFIKPDSHDYTFGAFMGCFRTDEALADSKFISLNFLTYSYRTYIDVLLSGSSINNLKPSDIESIEIPFPKKNEQARIANIISDLDEEIATLEIKLEKYKQIKQGMMQQLLTGKIRLVN